MKLERIEFSKYLKNIIQSKPEIIINLQGDMPNLDPKEIISLKNYLNKKNLCDVVTLACVY